jgi:hypothetical protein
MNTEVDLCRNFVIRNKISFLKCKAKTMCRYTAVCYFCFTLI